MISTPLRDGTAMLQLGAQLENFIADLRRSGSPKRTAFLFPGGLGSALKRALKRPKPGALPPSPDELGNFWIALELVCREIDRVGMQGVAPFAEVSEYVRQLQGNQTADEAQQFLEDFQRQNPAKAASTARGILSLLVSGAARPGIAP